ncbi:bublin coiled-coil protein-like [Glandiceps talaboti]
MVANTDGNGSGENMENHSNINIDGSQQQEADEFQVLDETLDQLDSCVSALEERSDNLNAKIREFLESARRDREEKTETQSKHKS